MLQNRLEHAYDLAAEYFALAGIEFDELEDCNHRSVGKDGDRVDIAARLEHADMGCVRVTRWPWGAYEVQPIP